MKKLMLGAMTLLAATTAVGCGTNNLPTSAVATRNALSAGSITVQGVTRSLGYNFDRSDKLAPKAHKQHMIRQGLLPKTVDNRNFASAVADQGHLGSCTAFAMGKGLREYLAKKNGERTVSLSALFLYYEERVQMGTVNQDSGATITDGMEVLSHTGIATEESWPYDINQFKVKPPAAAYSSAGEFKLHDATQLESFDDVKTALAKGQPVAFGFRVYESFRKVGADGMMPVPASNERLLGGHAVLAVGYDDEKKVLVVRNSWGEKWGDHGYFYMPYQVASGFQARDFWTASK
jgi:C1A family cysteine protease